MRIRSLCITTLLALLSVVVSMSCNSSDPAPDVVDIDFSVIRDDISPREIAEFQLAASAEGRIITQSRVDFTDDGTWDEWRPNTDSDVAEVYRYLFDDVGQHTVTVEVLEDDEVLGSASATVSVDDFGVLLEVTSVDNPDITTEPNPPCVIQIPNWTAEFFNSSTDPLADPSTHFVRMHYVILDYAWRDGVTTTPSESRPIGGYVPLDGSHSVGFRPLHPSEILPAQGKTADVRMTFIGYVGDITEIRVSAEAELYVEECP